MPKLKTHSASKKRFSLNAPCAQNAPVRPAGDRRADREGRAEHAPVCFRQAGQQRIADRRAGHRQILDHQGAPQQVRKRRPAPDRGRQGRPD